MDCSALGRVCRRSAMSPWWGEIGGKTLPGALRRLLFTYHSIQYPSLFLARAVEAREH